MSSRFHVRDLTENGDAAVTAGTRSVAVYSSGDTIEVIPQRNDAPEVDSTTIDTAKRTVPWMSPKQLGAAVIEALSSQPG